MGTTTHNNIKQQERSQNCFTTIQSIYKSPRLSHARVFLKNFKKFYVTFSSGKRRIKRSGDYLFQVLRLFRGRKKMLDFCNEMG
jgi:hypothetical protein